MAGRTTFVIAHRLSTISLADEIVVLEDGPAHRARHARRAARRLGALPRDRREGPARPGLPHPQAARAGGGGSVTPHGHWGPPVDDRPPVAPEDAGFRERLHLLWEDSRRRLRGTGDRGRKVRGLAALLRPYRTRTILAFVAITARRRRLARAGAARRRGDRQGHRPRRRRRAEHRRRALRPQRPGRLGHVVRADLADRLGRAARPGRPAPAHLRPPAGDAGLVLRAPARRAC